MSVESSTKPPVWYWVLAGIILVWNLFGVFVFSVMVLMVSGTVDIANEQAMATMNEAQRTKTLVTKDVILSTPMWANVAFAIAVGFGVLGSIALLRRRTIAAPFFVVSLLGVLAQNSYNYLLSDAVEKMGVGMSPIVILVAIITVPFAFYGSRRGWLTAMKSRTR